MKIKEISEKESLVGKLFKFNKIIVLVVKEEEREHDLFGNRCYVLFPGQGIDTVSEVSLEAL